MIQKGDQTKKKILDTAKKLFSEKGFSSVTMSDLCEATGLSRGGLYRHFSSTEEVFIALLETDKNDWQSEMDHAISAGVPAVCMLKHYLDQVRTDIDNGSGGLSLAVYEFQRTIQGKNSFLEERYHCGVNMMKCLLQYGQQRGEFRPSDLQTEAEHLVIFMDGLKIASVVIPFSQDDISRQLNGVLEKLTLEDHKK